MLDSEILSTQGILGAGKCRRVSDRLAQTVVLKRVI